MCCVTVNKDNITVDEELNVSLSDISTPEHVSAEYESLVTKRKANNRLVIEFGNMFEGTTMMTYVKVVKAPKKFNPSSLIKSVAFNINPSYLKPTETLKEPTNKKSGYCLERSHGFSVSNAQRRVSNPSCSQAITDCLCVLVISNKLGLSVVSVLLYQLHG